MKKIIEVAIIATNMYQNYAVVHFTDGAVVEIETASQDVLNFINKMAEKHHFDIICTYSFCCIKFNRSFYDNDPDFRYISVTSDLVVRKEIIGNMPFSKYDEGIWYKCTGFEVMGKYGFSFEYVKNN